jgi:hypothetical protein
MFFYITFFLTFFVGISTLHKFCVILAVVKKLRGDKLDTGKAEDGIKEWLKERCFRKK